MSGMTQTSTQEQVDKGCITRCTSLRPTARYSRMTHPSPFPIRTNMGHHLPRPNNDTAFSNFSISFRYCSDGLGVQRVFEFDLAGRILNLSIIACRLRHRKMTRWYDTPMSLLDCSAHLFSGTNSDQSAIQSLSRIHWLTRLASSCRRNQARKVNFSLIFVIHSVIKKTRL